TVAVRNGAGAQRSQIGSGFWLGKSLTPDHFSGGDGRQVPRLLLRCPVAHDRWPDPVDPHVLSTAGFVVGPHLLTQYRLLPDRAAAATVLFRPGQSQQSVGGQQFAKRLGGLEVSRIVGTGTQEAVRDVRGNQLAQVLSELHGVGAEVVIHRYPFGSPS